MLARKVIGKEEASSTFKSEVLMLQLYMTLNGYISRPVNRSILRR